jgi:catechol-2,3-dioxygenase
LFGFFSSFYVSTEICFLGRIEVIMMQQRTVKALGEIALRVRDLDSMQQFYEEVIGLELMKRFPHVVFFKIAEGYGGHTQILALFHRTQDEGSRGVAPEKSTVDHFAFTIALADYDGEKKRLEQLGFKVKTAEHAWVHWRSLYIRDPEGNLVELVCYNGAM